MSSLSLAHVRLLCWKNYLQKRRNWRNTFSEIGIPILLIYLMCYMYHASPAQHKTVPDNLNLNTRIWIPTVHLLPLLLAKTDLILGLSPNTSDTRDFLRELDELYPGQAALGIPPFSTRVRLFDTTADFHTYMAAATKWNHTVPGLYAALEVRTLDAQMGWNIQLRMNETGGGLAGSLASPSPGTGGLGDILKAVTKAQVNPQSKYLFQSLDGPDFPQTVQAPGIVPLQRMLQNVMTYHHHQTSDPNERIKDQSRMTPTLFCTELFQVLQSSKLYWQNVQLESGKACIQQVENATTKDDYYRFFRSLDFMPARSTFTSVFPIPEHLERQDPMEGSILTYMIYFWILPIVQFVRGLVSEKESKVREGMLMMGCRESAWYLSWGLTYAFICGIISFVGAHAFSSHLLVHSQFLLLCFYLWTFALSLLAFGFALSTVFDRSKTAVAAFTFSLFLLCAPTLTYRMSVTSASGVSKILNLLKHLTPLSSPTLYTLGLLTFMELDHIEEHGVAFSHNFFQSSAKGISVYAALVGMWLTIFGYALLGWYLDKVLPKEFGVQLPWYFILTSSYWQKDQTRRRRQGDETEEDECETLLTTTSLEGDDDEETKPREEIEVLTSCSIFEPLSAENRAKIQQDKCIRVQHLCKTFGDEKVAVANVSFQICENEIFGLLGMNGAGKTTTISMLSGLLSPTSGDAYIYGQSIRNEMPSIRQSLGVCPQHDVLFEDMTVEEHLRVFGQLKGIPVASLASAIDAKLDELGLSEKKEAIATTLSGGQKRKLSVAIALMGDSKVVFLDEPTSGMDPYSRRFLWNILQQNREGRMMILTTHSMDEADILSSRIAIMANGELRCCGSSMFLKSHYGVGYNLTLVKRSPDVFDSHRVCASIQEFVPKMKLLSDVGTELSCRLPTSSSSQFPALFEFLESNQAKLGFHSYGVSVTTVEEVFLAIAQNEELTKVPTTVRNKSKNLGKTRTTTTTVHQQASAWTQCRALVIKRAKYTLRDRRMLLAQFILPLAFLALMLHLMSNFTLSGPQVFLPQGIWPESPSLFLVSSSSSELDKPKLASMLANVPRLSHESIDVPFWISPETGDDDDDRDNMKMANYLLKHAKNQTRAVYGALDVVLNHKQQPSFPHWELFHDASADLSLPIYMNLLSSAHCAAATTTTATTAHVLDKKGRCVLELSTLALPSTEVVTEQVASILGFVVAMSMLMTLSTVSSAYIMYIVRERQDSVKHLQMLSGTSVPAYWLSNYVWDVIVYLAVELVILLMLVMFDIRAYVSDNRLGAVATSLLCYGLSIIPMLYLASFGFSSHASAQTYLSYFNSSQTMVMFLSFVLGQMPFLCGKVAWWEVHVLRYFPGYAVGNSLLQISTLEMMWWKQQCIHDLNDPEDMLYNLKDLLAGVETHKTYGVFDAEVTGDNAQAMLITALVCFTLTVIVDLVQSIPAIRQWVEHSRDWVWSFWSFRRRRTITRAESHFDEMDADVHAEALRVDQMLGHHEHPRRPMLSEEEETEDALVLGHLRKVYRGGKVAVSDLTFGLPVGSCFGFLGINGAGKSSTLKMLTGMTVPTSGRATILGLDILTHQRQARKRLGYCPQENALLDLLTTREHLELFAALKGVPERKVERVVLETLEDMGLVDYEHVQSTKLSGGNKRKLQVGLALIGHPPIVFLDEPSAGVDAYARRRLWDIISQVSTERRECTIVLTTHNMEEAQAICSLASIMVDGDIRCWGTIQHLKARYGKGILCEFKLDQDHEQLRRAQKQMHQALGSAEPHSSSVLISKDDLRVIGQALGNVLRIDEIHERGSGWMLFESSTTGQLVLEDLADWWCLQNITEALDDFLHATFSQVRRLEQHGQYVKYEIESKVEFSTIFRAIETHKVRLHITEYSVSQPTLEQIFNQFAAHQQYEHARPHQVETS